MHLHVVKVHPSVDAPAVSDGYHGALDLDHLEQALPFSVQLLGPSYALFM